MHTELKKLPLSLLLKRKMYRINILMDTIVMKQLKDQDRSSCIYYKNLVIILLILDVRNVFISILIQQFNPLFPFETTNYRAIV